MRVDRDMMPGRILHHAQVVVAHPLSLMPFAQHRALRHVLSFDLPGIADIAGLHRIDANRVEQRERLVHLPLVVADRATGLVVADQVHALRLRIGSESAQVVVGCRLAEIEVPAIGEPVAIPAHVPAFDQHAAEAVGGGEVDVALGVFRGRPVPRSRRPRFLVQVQRPPHPHVLVRLEPADIAEPVRLVEVEDQAGLDQVGRALADLDRPPRRLERRRPHDRRWPATRRQRGMQHLPLALRQVHAGVVDQRRLVQGHVQAIVGAQVDVMVAQIGTAAWRDRV